jgi:hypothetical protein
MLKTFREICPRSETEPLRARDVSNFRLGWPFGREESHSGLTIEADKSLNVGGKIANGYS